MECWPPFGTLAGMFALHLRGGEEPAAVASVQASPGVGAGSRAVDNDSCRDSVAALPGLLFQGGLRASLSARRCSASAAKISEAGSRGRDLEESHHQTPDGFS